MRWPIRSIAHLSDLHFGNHFDFLIEPLLRRVEAFTPDLTVVSGDFVEHATIAEFELAKVFVERLPKPRLVVAGNHDLAFYDPVRRYRDGLKDYKRYIAEELEPMYRDDEMVVVGVNTPRRLQLKGGRIGRAQVARIHSETCDNKRDRVKVVVTHHPLDLPAPHQKRTLVTKARRAVEALSPCVDLLLAGHVHLSSTGGTAARYIKTGHSVVFAQAGTAISRRNKGEPNSFNLIQLSHERISIQHQVWDEATKDFQTKDWTHFEHNDKGWAKVEPGGPKEQIQVEKA